MDYRFNITEKEENVLRLAVSGVPFNKIDRNSSERFSSAFRKLLRLDGINKTTQMHDLFSISDDEYLTSAKIARRITPDQLDKAIEIAALAGIETLLKKISRTIKDVSADRHSVDSMYLRIENAKSVQSSSFREKLVCAALQGLLANPKLEKEIATTKSWIYHTTWAFADGVINSSEQLDDHKY